MGVIRTVPDESGDRHLAELGYGFFEVFGLAGLRDPARVDGPEIPFGFDCGEELDLTEYPRRRQVGRTGDSGELQTEDAVLYASPEGLIWI